MAEVKILIEGYLAKDDPSKGSCSTVSLVKDNDINMIVDPGTLKDPKLLVEKLKENNLSIEDINFVFITHSHMDHYRNIGMFQKAKAIDYWGIWNGDRCEDRNEQFTDNIQIIKTPGHTYDSLSLLVQTNQGTVAICGDVFWKENYPIKDLYATNYKELQKSRKKLLKISDWIVPGHGNIYKTK